MRDRERGTRWMNVAHIHAPSGRHGSRSGCMRAARPCACRRSTPAACRAFSTFEQTPDGGPVGAYRGGEPIATTRAWTRGYFAAAHLGLSTFDFASFACGLDIWWRQILRVVNSA